MLKTGITVIMLTLVSAPAGAQQRSESTGSASFPAYLLNSGGGHNQNPLYLKDDRRCLVRKATGRTECRSMAEWRRMAKEIDTKASQGAK